MLEEIRKVRLEKLEKIKARGFEVYPAVSDRTHEIQKLIADFGSLESSQNTVVIAGRVMSLRGQGAVVFCDLFDGTARFQILVKKDSLPEDTFEFYKEVVDIGDFIEVSGTLFVTKTGQQTLEVKNWKMFSKSLLPLPEKWHGITDEEERLRKRYLDILTSEDLPDRFRKRSAFWNTIRSYLLEKGFIEVETPVLENTTGGADARPFVTHHNALDIDVYLRISAGELWQKRLMAAGFPKTFEIGRA